MTEGIMKRKTATTAALCLLIVALIALAIAPAASAKATRMPVKLSEVFVSSTPTAYKETGGVAHIEFDNVFYDTSPTHDPTAEGWTYTHLYAVATLVDGVPTDSVMRGTARRETLDGSVWEGKFAGTMNLDPDVLTWACICVGKGVSGPCAGWIFVSWNVKAEAGPFAAADITGWAMAPHGL